MKQLNELNILDYFTLQGSGMLYEMYPEATGSFVKDCCEKPSLHDKQYEWKMRYYIHSLLQEGNYGSAEEAMNAIMRHFEGKVNPSIVFEEVNIYFQQEDEENADGNV